MAEDAPNDRALLGLLACVVPPHGAVYLSTPITNGPRYIEWRRRNEGFGTPDHIVAANLRDGRRLATALRSRHDLVITPTELDVPGWSQPRYRALWCDVVAKFARQAVFADGWQLSTGCVAEFMAARRAVVTTVDQREASLDDTAARDALAEAVAELRSVGLDAGAQEAALALVVERGAVRSVHGT